MAETARIGHFRTINSVLIFLNFWEIYISSKKKFYNINSRYKVLTLFQVHLRVETGSGPMEFAERGGPGLHLGCQRHQVRTILNVQKKQEYILSFLKKR